MGGACTKAKRCFLCQNTGQQYPRGVVTGPHLSGFNRGRCLGSQSASALFTACTAVMTAIPAGMTTCMASTTVSNCCNGADSECGATDEQHGNCAASVELSTCHAYCSIITNRMTWPFQLSVVSIRCWVPVSGGAQYIKCAEGWLAGQPGAQPLRLYMRWCEEAALNLPCPWRGQKRRGRLGWPVAEALQSY
jgi:hypothetical protein